MPRQVIIDCDPGIEDAIALCLTLFHPDLEVLAVTAVAGNVDAEQASRNVQALVEHFDPPKYPRLGAAIEPENAPAIDTRHLNGDDGLGNVGFACSELHHQHPSEKIIHDIVHANPEQVTLVCLGPLTNLARAIRRDPELPTLLGQVIMTGGSVACGGNVTAAAEYNMFFDPLSAREVFLAPTTKTLIPLDVTQKVIFDISLLEELPDESSRAGKLLRQLAQSSFRAHRQELGLEGVHWADALAVLAAVRPELFSTEEMTGDVEVRGTITTGATVFDRRRHRELPNMEVATRVDARAARNCLVQGLRMAATRS